MLPKIRLRLFWGLPTGAMTRKPQRAVGHLMRLAKSHGAGILAIAGKAGEYYSPVPNGGFRHAAARDNRVVRDYPARKWAVRKLIMPPPTEAVNQIVLSAKLKIVGALGLALVGRLVDVANLAPVVAVA